MHRHHGNATHSPGAEVVEVARTPRVPSGGLPVSLVDPHTHTLNTKWKAMKGHPGVEFLQAKKITITIDHCGTAPKITKPCEDGVIPLELLVCVCMWRTHPRKLGRHTLVVCC